MNKLTFKEKLGYGSASLGDVLTYNMISSYLLFFLTTAAGIRPAAAGVISIVGAVWNALFNPVMGFAADQVFTSRGRRRPVMFLFAIPLMLSLFAIFTDVPLPSAVKPFYYGLILMTVWTCYTGFFVPYLALGAAYTTDYEDRTVLRLYASFFNTAGTFLSFMFPSMAVDFMTSYGLSRSCMEYRRGLCRSDHCRFHYYNRHGLRRKGSALLPQDRAYQPEPF